MPWYNWGVVCQKQVSGAGTSNYSPQILWGVITCPCPWYLLLTQHYSIDFSLLETEPLFQPKPHGIIFNSRCLKDNRLSFKKDHIVGLGQDCSLSSATAFGVPQSWTVLSTWVTTVCQIDSFPHRAVTTMHFGVLTYFVRSMGLLPDTQNWGLRMRRECRERFHRHRLQRKPLVSDPGMHHGKWRLARAVMRVGIANPRWRENRIIIMHTVQYLL